LLSASASFAQSRFDSWTSDDGLPQNNINDLLQTSDGYLWLATFIFLVRYDGVRFKTFNSGNSRGIKSNRMLKLLEDRESGLWVTTEASGVIRYRDGVFKTLNTEDGLPDNAVLQIRLAGQHGDVVVYTSLGAVKWDGERFTPLDPFEAGRAA
jgi:ligand-binding sensor domain-containing protein